MTIGDIAGFPASARWCDQPLAIGADPPGYRHITDDPQALRCQHMTFEIHNLSGKTVRGIEIELAGLAPADVFRAYYLNRHGTPVIVTTRNTVCIRFECLWRVAAEHLSHNCRPPAGVNPGMTSPVVWELALHGSGTSERFRLEMSNSNVVATYRWLVASDTPGDSLFAENLPVFILDARTRPFTTQRPIQL